MNLELINRLWKRTDTINGCWLWKGAKVLGGYGTMRLNGYNIYVHRLSVIIYHKANPLDDRWGANHICTNKNCWNPLHLYQGTQRDNKRDTIDFNIRIQTKDCCPRGHEFTPENTLIESRSRKCKTCKKEKDRVRYINNLKKRSQCG